MLRDCAEEYLKQIEERLGKKDKVNRLIKAGVIACLFYCENILKRY